MIQDKIFFDEKDPTGLSYNTPFTFYGSYQGRLWSKAPGGEIKYYTQNSDLSVYATTGSNQFNGNQAITGSLTVTGGIIGTTATSSYVEYSNVANKPTLVSGSSQVSFSGITNKPTLVSGSAQVAQFGYAITGSNQFKASQAITGSLVVTEQIIAQTINVQQVTSSIVYSCGSNIFGTSLGNTQQFTGSVAVTGSLAVFGVGTFSNSVGINRTPSSGFKLDIQGNEGLRILDNDVLRSIVITPPTSVATGIISTASGQGISLQATNVSGNLTFETAGSQRMRIASTGAACFACELTAKSLGTNDLILNNLNHDHANYVDGTRGSWLIQEGACDLFIINQVSCKKYKFNLIEIE